MTSRVVFHPAAVRDVQQALGWYGRKDPSAAAAFSRELERAIDGIAAMPERFAARSDGTRRVVLARFPFLLTYRIRDDTIQVVAVAHQRRRPDFWRGRT